MVEDDWQLTRIIPTVGANGPDGAERLPATGGSLLLGSASAGALAAVGGVAVRRSVVALTRPR